MPISATEPRLAERGEQGMAMSAATTRDEVVGDVVDGEDPSAISVRHRLLHQRVDGDLLPREREADGEARDEHRHPVMWSDTAISDQAAREEGARDDALLREPLLERAHGEDAERARRRRPRR